MIFKGQKGGREKDDRSINRGGRKMILKGQKGGRKMIGL